MPLRDSDDRRQQVSSDPVRLPYVMVQSQEVDGRLRHVVAVELKRGEILDGQGRLRDFGVLGLNALLEPPQGVSTRTQILLQQVGNLGTVVALNGILDALIAD